MSDNTKLGAFASLLDGFGPIQKIFLFGGFVVFVMGVPSGFTLQNRTLMIGTALFMWGIAGHYFGELKACDVQVDSERIRGKIIWGNVFLAIVFSFLTATAIWFAYSSHQAVH
jgi:hypothetical protein